MTSVGSSSIPRYPEKPKGLVTVEWELELILAKNRLGKLSPIDVNAVSWNSSLLSATQSSKMVDDSEGIKQYL